MVDDAKTHTKSRTNICIHHEENEAWEKTCPRMLTTQWQSLFHHTVEQTSQLFWKHPYKQDTNHHQRVDISARDPTQQLDKF